jgi:hypothetical protein
MLTLHISLYVRFYFLLICLLGYFPAKAGQYFWVGGSGEWGNYGLHWATSSGGQVFHNQVPTANDTVVFDSLSFTAANEYVHADSAMLFCHTMIWDHVQFHPKFTGGNAAGYAFKLYGSLLLDTGMTWFYQSPIRFDGLTSGNQIRCAGQYLPQLEFYGLASSSWILADSLSVGALQIFGGIIQTAGFPVTANSIQAIAPLNQAALLLDTSIIRVAAFSVDGLQVLIDADSSQLVVSGSNFSAENCVFHFVTFLTFAEINGSSFYERAIFQSSINIQGSNTFDTLLAITSGISIVLSSGTTQTIIDSLALHGSCGGMTYLHTDMIGGVASIQKNSGSIYTDYLVLEGIVGTGGANFISDGSIVLGQTSGWNITNAPVARVLYWVGGSGSWSDGAHWALSAGGAGGNCPPTPLDDVFFDGQSFLGNDTIHTTTEIIFTKNMDWTSVFGSITFQIGSLNYYVFGSLALHPLMNINQADIVFQSPLVGEQILSAGQNLGDLSFYGIGSWTMSDALNCSNLFIYNGTFNSANHAIQTQQVKIGASNVNFGTSSIHCNSWLKGLLGSVNASQTSITINGSIFNNGTNDVFNDVVFTNGSHIQASASFHAVTISGTTSITGNNTFDLLTITPNGNPIVFGSTTTQTVLTQFTLVNSCASPSYFQASASGSPAFINQNNGSVNIGNLILQDIVATGNAVFTATYTVASGNTTGWAITPPPSGTFYWIGGSGDWNDPQHWSATSGGPAGTCIPFPNNDVKFDQNSFSGNNESVLVNVPNAFCHTLTWANCIGSPTLVGGTGTLTASGSILLDNSMIYQQNILILTSNTSDSIRTGGNTIRKIYFNGSGTWNLADNFSAQDMHLSNGSFYANGFSLVLDKFMSTSAASRSIDLLHSTIHTNEWHVAQTSTLNMQAANTIFFVHGNTFESSNQVYGEVTFDALINITSSDTFHYIRVTDFATFARSLKTDTLFLDNPGKQTILNSGIVLTVDSCFWTSGSASQSLSLESSVHGSAASIQKTSDTVCLNFVALRDVHALGSAIFYAGNQSTNIANNTGWIFQDCNPVLSNVWPGDANNDLTADNLDLLSIGVAFGQNGPPRANASNVWVAQPMFDWETMFANGTDTKHADCDGNGTVGYSDTTALNLNFGQIHPPLFQQPPVNSNVGALLWMSTPNYAVNAGDTCSIGIMLGTNNAPVSDAYGIAFDLLFNDSLIVPGSLWIEFTNSWMAPTGQVVWVMKADQHVLLVKIGISRINQMNAAGSGEIARLHFQTNPNRSGVLKGHFSNITLADAHEVQQPTQQQLGSTLIIGIEDELQIGQLNIFPNPSNGFFQVAPDMQMGSEMGLVVTDISGRIIHSQQTVFTGSFTLDLSNESTGVYFMTIRTSEKAYITRLVKQ